MSAGLYTDNLKPQNGSLRNSSIAVHIKYGLDQYFPNCVPRNTGVPHDEKRDSAIKFRWQQLLAISPLKY
jgi:hypothetical protein